MGEAWDDHRFTIRSQMVNPTDGIDGIDDHLIKHGVIDKAW